MDTPDYLYKYQRLTAHSLASVINETVWLAKPSTFNDPFDCALTLSSDLFEESMRHAISDISERMAKQGISTEGLNRIRPEDRQRYEELRKALLSISERIGVFSLSAIRDHMLMWSHYAAQHHGLCVEYDCREGTDLRKHANPVQYVTDIPPLSLADVHGPNKHRFLEVALFTKAQHWEYEQEWRVVMPEGNRVYAAPSPITSIMFGARMPMEEKVMVYLALKNKAGISFKEAYLADDKFAIEFRPFSLE